MGPAARLVSEVVPTACRMLDGGSVNSAVNVHVFLNSSCLSADLCYFKVAVPT